MIRTTILLALLAITNPIWCFEAQFKADSLHGSLGDIISFAWDIKHDPTVQLSIRDIDTEGAGIEILEQQVTSQTNGSELRFETAVYDSVGVYRFPSLMVYAEGAAGLDSFFLQGPDLQIYSILTVSDTSFRDIKGLHKIRTPFNLMILLWILVAGVFSYAIYRMIKWRKTRKESVEQHKIIIPPEQAHVIALRDLEKLKRSKYLHLEQFKLYYSELTHIIKQYYENRYLLDALELTTSELMEKMESMPGCDEQIVSFTRRLLEMADLIKFAKGTSTELDSGNALTQAVEIINYTKIQNEQGVNP
ncbi:MAG: hypothetical protein U9Q77_00515 [Candidatus Marinimicrobia bacterium]|nr:hypothetical protein [Candidatus Neomarinimicrobiota bacterium]